MNSKYMTESETSKTVSLLGSWQIFFCFSCLNSLSIYFIVDQLQLSPFPPNYPPLSYPTPHTHSILPSLLSLFIGPLSMFLDLTLPLLSPITSLAPPLWSLSVCSLFPCLWFYFAGLFVLLIRFHL